MKKPYTKKLETPIGIFYLTYNVDSTDSSIHCSLLDSDKKWITNIYHKETIKELKQIKSVGDLVNLGIAQTCSWAPTIEELTDLINDLYYWETEYKEDAFTLEDMQNYDFLNKVGDTYFIIDFED